MKDLLNNLSYTEFLARLRQDLKLDVRTDILPGRLTHEQVDPAWVDGHPDVPSVRSMYAKAIQVAADYEFVLEDTGRVVDVMAGAVLTLPAAVDTPTRNPKAFKPGACVEVCTHTADAVTFVAADGVTLELPFDRIAQAGGAGTTIGFRMYAANVWVASGQLAPAA